MGTRCNVIFYDSTMTTKKQIEKKLDPDIKNVGPSLHFSILYRHYDGDTVGADIRENRFFEKYNDDTRTHYILGSPLTHMVSSFQRWSFNHINERKFAKFLGKLFPEKTTHVISPYQLKKDIENMPISRVGDMGQAIYDLVYDWTKMGRYEITNNIHGDIEYLWWVDIRNQVVEGFVKTYNVTDWKEREKYNDYSWRWKVVETPYPEDYGVAQC